MAHFAEIDENNIVLRVLVIDDLYETDGHNYLSNTLGLGGTWVKTSYNTTGGQHREGGKPFRYNFAGIGHIFDPNFGDEGAFYAPQPFPSWKLGPATAIWKAPKPEPDNGKMHFWNEEIKDWEEFKPVEE